MAALSNRENMLRTLEYRNPEWIPCRVLIPLNYWDADREKCEALVKSHLRIFENQNLKDYGHYNARAKKGYITDSWGCVWRNELDSIMANC